MINQLAGHQVAVLPGGVLNYQIIFYHCGEKMVLETDCLDYTLAVRIQCFIDEVTNGENNMYRVEYRLDGRWVIHTTGLATYGEACKVRRQLRDKGYAVQIVRSINF